MIGKLSNPCEQELFRPRLLSFIDPDNELVLLANKIDWSYFENEFAPLYSEKGRRAIAIRIAKKEGVQQRQTYTRESKELLQTTYNSKHPKRAKVAKAAMRHLKTLAGRQVRVLETKLDDDAKETYAERLKIYHRILEQERTTKDKIYSPHKPYTTCIAKGKAGIPYEFGNKVGMITTAKSRIVVAIKAFEGNPHDSKTLLQQMEDNHQKLPKRLAYDRGGRGAKEIKGVEILTPGTPKATDSAYERAKKRLPFRRRAGIEPHFSHFEVRLPYAGELSPWQGIIDHQCDIGGYCMEFEEDDEETQVSF